MPRIQRGTQRDRRKSARVECESEDDIEMIAHQVEQEETVREQQRFGRAIVDSVIKEADKREKAETLEKLTERRRLLRDHLAEVRKGAGVQRDEEESAESVADAGPAGLRRDTGSRSVDSALAA